LHTFTNQLSKKMAIYLEMNTKNIYYLFITLILQKYLKKLIGIFCFFILLSPNVFGQIQISGKVFDMANNTPLVGTSIITGDQQGTTSDIKGTFQFEVSTLPDTIQISSVGYETRQIILEEASFLQIGLESKPTEMQAVVVTAFRGQQKLYETPASISVLGPTELHRDDDVNITPVLNRVPGVFMHNGAYNTNRITIRGIGARSLFSTAKIRAYLNDIPLTNGIGETTIEDIDLSLLGRLEVIKGPAASEYGAGLGGTILMQTAKSPYRQTSLRNQTTVGSYGLVRNVSAFKTGNDKMNFSLVYNYMHSDGYRENNEYDRQSITALGEFYAGENTSVSVIATAIDLKAFIPSSIDSATFAENPRAAAGNWGATRGFEDGRRALFGVALKQQISPLFSHNTSVFTGFRYAYELRPFNILREGNNSIGGRTAFTFNNNDAAFKPEITIGAEIYNEWYSWQTYENNDRERGANLSDNEELRNYTNLFAKATFRFTNKLLATAAFNYNNTDYQYTDFFDDETDLSGDYGFEGIFSPRLAVNYELNDKIYLFAAASHGFSPPTLEETLTPDGQINPDIQPERGMNYEVGARGTLLENRLSFDVTVYSMRIRDLLVARRTAADAFIGVNAGRTTHNGLEFSSNYQLIKQGNTLFKQASLFTSLAYNSYTFDEFLDEGDDFSGNELTGVPDVVFNAGIDVVMHNGLYGNINFLAVGAMPIRDDNSVFSDAYEVVNTKVGFRTMLGKNFELDTFAGINNLLDEKYAAMLGVNAGSFGNRPPRYFYPGLPRNFVGSVALSYRFY